MIELKRIILEANPRNIWEGIILYIVAGAFILLCATLPAIILNLAR